MSLPQGFLLRKRRGSAKGRDGETARRRNDAPVWWGEAPEWPNGVRTATKFSFS